MRMRGARGFYSMKCTKHENSPEKPKTDYVYLEHDGIKDMIPSDYDFNRS